MLCPRPVEAVYYMLSHVITMNYENWSTFRYGDKHWDWKKSCRRRSVSTFYSNRISSNRICVSANEEISFSTKEEEKKTIFIRRINFFKNEVQPSPDQTGQTSMFVGKKDAEHHPMFSDAFGIFPSSWCTPMKFGIIYTSKRKSSRFLRSYR